MWTCAVFSMGWFANPKHDRRPLAGPKPTAKREVRSFDLGNTSMHGGHEAGAVQGGGEALERATGSNPVFEIVMSHRDDANCARAAHPQAAHFGETCGFVGKQRASPKQTEVHALRGRVGEAELLSTHAERGCRIVRQQPSAELSGESRASDYRCVRPFLKLAEANLGGGIGQ